MIKHRPLSAHFVLSEEERRVIAAYRRLQAESVKTREPRRMVISLNPNAPATVDRCQPMR